MSDKHETIEDIVAEMRDATMNGEYDDATVDAWADRIEAAAKRERDATREKSSQVGNEAKMREALYAITLIDTRMLKRLLCELVEADIFDGGQIRNTIHAVEKARQALSAPPRNCDIYDAESCRMAYHINGDGLMTMQAFADWLFAPVEEGATNEQK